MKPGQMKNIAAPVPSESAQLAAVATIGRNSSQTPETLQLSQNANRLRAPSGPPSEGRAQIERSEVEEDQDANRTRSTRANYAVRKKVFE